MATLSDRLTRIFEAIVDEYDAQPEDRRQRLWHSRSFGREGFEGFGEDLSVLVDDLDELRDFDLIDVDYGSRMEYLVKPTAHGREVLHRFRRERARSENPEPVDLEWSSLRAILHAAVDSWTALGAPSSGYVSLEAVARGCNRDEQDFSLVRGVELLAEGDWLEIEYDDETQAPMVRPTMRSVVATRGWPGGDAETAAERLLTALDELETSSTDAATRGWAARARETLMEVGTKTLAEVVSKSVGSSV